LYTCAAQEDVPELTTLATTVNTWWLEILWLLDGADFMLIL
jgi:hypothetical protein